MQYCPEMTAIIREEFRDEVSKGTLSTMKFSREFYSDIHTSTYPPSPHMYAHANLPLHNLSSLCKQCSEFSSRLSAQCCTRRFINRDSDSLSLLKLTTIIHRSVLFPLAIPATLLVGKDQSIRRKFDGFCRHLQIVNTLEIIYFI